MKFWSSHKHCFFEVDRQWMESRMRNWEGKIVGGPTPITKITERCVDKSCGKYRQQTLVGHLPGGHFDLTGYAENRVIHE